MDTDTTIGRVEALASPIYRVEHTFLRILERVITVNIQGLQSSVYCRVDCKLSKATPEVLCFETTLRGFAFVYSLISKKILKQAGNTDTSLIASNNLAAVLSGGKSVVEFVTRSKK